ncbi:hypothetical protein ATO6_12240 [Oceanicola sp. 22II-s10i]|uniref:DUF2971 domain-containing protein n=1 Tax=Oceanicola sp. 22II-s10i TaxID=1317116 RepID=UPI000B525096|nr:DUF2971 domain-containing protein [Oceanicola sp. 22II-s10i]OWU84458.1 hypothetical protein ATO6_12240 [Oceanicola sp. 22II-s10i]
MDLDDATVKFYQIFNPGLMEEVQSVAENGKRFAYYTSADTAMQIIRNKELWFRNATVMNDFSEISYGLELIGAVFSGNEGENFRNAVESIFPGIIGEANELLSGWESDWRSETYIACVSAHDAKEDKSGRLSMWRAYGDTALIVKNTPMVAVTDLLAVYSLPVLYLSEQDLTQYLAKITQAIEMNAAHLSSLGRETVVTYIHRMLFRLAIATKHPGFEEEKEWRLYYRPSEGISPEMTKATLVINGTPQTVFKLRLANEPEHGLFGADIPSLLDRIIVGPTEYPYMSYKAFADVLEAAGVENAASKVILSDIPLRVST